METALPLSQRSLDELLSEARLARAGGLVVVRDREGLRHGVWVDDGYMVGALVAGRFDPLLLLLRQRGVLSAALHHAAVGLLRREALRSGELATRRFGVDHGVLRDTLREQLVARLAALRALAASEGYDARLERRPVPCSERSVRLPLGPLLREDTPRTGRDEARRRLRALARALHPDRHGDLAPDLRDRLARLLAEATAAYHGFA